MSMVGSDAVLIGDFPSPRTYGCFPVILAEYVREEPLPCRCRMRSAR